MFFYAQWTAIENNAWTGQEINLLQVNKAKYSKNNRK